MELQQKTYIPKTWSGGKCNLSDQWEQIPVPLICDTGIRPDQWRETQSSEPDYPRLMRLLIERARYRYWSMELPSSDELCFVNVKWLTRTTEEHVQKAYEELMPSPQIEGSSQELWQGSFELDMEKWDTEKRFYDACKSLYEKQAGYDAFAEMFKDFEYPNGYKRRNRLNEGEMKYIEMCAQVSVTG